MLFCSWHAHMGALLLPGDIPMILSVSEIFQY